MPARATIDAFVAAVESGDYLGAIERYYHPDASMQENQSPPRSGRDALIAHETKMLAGVASGRTLPAGAVLVEGDTVVINWVFEFTGRDGRVRRLDELAMQTWDGERIRRERFYYDPGTF